jgi:hypothetical protein
MVKKATSIAAFAAAAFLFGSAPAQGQYDSRRESNRHAIDEAPSSWRYDRYGYDNRNPNDDWFFDYYDYSDRGTGDPDMEFGGNDPFGVQQPFDLSGRGRGDPDMEFGGNDPFGLDSQLGVFDEVGDAGWADVYRNEQTQEKEMNRNMAEMHWSECTFHFACGS